MWGLGDNVFQRPFIRALSSRATVYLDTPWPEIYSDLPVKVFRNGEREGRLRTQTKNILRQPAHIWTPPPHTCSGIKMSYGMAIGRWSIVEAMERIIPLKGAPFVFDLPPLPKPISLIERAGTRPIAVIRPVTVRSEWTNEARNPRPEYVERIAERLMDSHFVISVADLKDRAEWMIGIPPPAHMVLHHGELALLDLLGLCAHADIIVGGVGWIVPVSCAVGTPAFIILGGHGAHNHPKVITDPRMPLDQLGFAKPDYFCMCMNMRHKCDKTISDLDRQFEQWAEKLGASNARADNLACA